VQFSEEFIKDFIAADGIQIFTRVMDGLLQREVDKSFSMKSFVHYHHWNA